MARSKEEKAAFIAHLRAAAKELGESNPVVPSTSPPRTRSSNALMILFQNPRATQCAGFHAWKAAGRAVRKGAKGIAIPVYQLGTRTNEQGEDTPHLLLALCVRYSRHRGNNAGIATLSA
jgi:hypothetical protein